jgi:hypothetical protein
MLTREEGKAVFQWREFVDAEILSDLAGSELDSRLFDGGSRQHAIANALDSAGRDSVIEMLGLIAHQRCRMKAAVKDGRGVDIADLNEVLSPVYVSDAVDDDAQRRLATALVQFAFFGAGRRAGVVDFTHPILAEYLAGLYAAGVLARATMAASSGGSGNPLSQLAVIRGGIREAIGTMPLDRGSVFHRTIARAIAAEPKIKSFLTSAGGSLNARSLEAAVKILVD